MNRSNKPKAFRPAKLGKQITVRIPDHIRIPLQLFMNDAFNGKKSKCIHKIWEDCLIKEGYNVRKSETEIDEAMMKIRSQIENEGLENVLAKLNNTTAIAS